MGAEQKGEDGGADGAPHTCACSPDSAGKRRFRGSRSRDAHARSHPRVNFSFISSRGASRNRPCLTFAARRSRALCPEEEGSPKRAGGVLLRRGGPPRSGPGRRTRLPPVPPVPPVPGSQGRTEDLEVPFRR